MVIYAKDTYQLPQKYINNNKADLTGYTGRKRGIMFKYRVEFTDDNTAEVTASRDTIILLETLIRYGIVKKITVKS